ncbi:hypothetical protein [Neorhodopirellula pilleata]|uniref:Uncharacterized protein n=1 Tax=Neorhodopirellula pilleata TaxID=2714738 RepID=A0A5C6A538_9BACT|nr:hypothetical protein [Neorhodopirellula pilleata]TWT93503.1 hypothetical protein Pla100_40210 [Neorhodopirellula pilleata]
MTTNETILSVIPGNTEHERLIVVLRSMPSATMPTNRSLGLFDPHTEQTPEASSSPSLPSARTFCEELISVRERPVVLRQQSFSPAVGWFTQSELEMTQDQWSMMRCTVMPQQRMPQHRAMQSNQRASAISADSSPLTRRRFDRFAGDGDASVVPFAREQAASA